MTPPGRMTHPQMQRARIAVTVLFFTNGAIFANVLPRYPMVKDELAVNAATFGALVACFPAGAMIAGLAAGRVIRRYSSASTAVVGTYIVAAALAGAALALQVHPLLFGAAMFLGGAADAIVDVAQNAHGMRVQRHYGRSIINGFHAAWSAGAVIGGLCGSAAQTAGLPLVAHLAISGIIFAGAALAVRRWALPGLDTDEVTLDDAAPARAAASPRLSQSAGTALAALAVVALAGTFVEDAGNTWSAIYMRDVALAPGHLTGLAFVAMVGAQFVGRLTGDRLTDRFGARAVAVVGGILIAAGFIPMLAWPHAASTIAAFTLAGFGCATLVPAAFDAADRLPGLPVGTGLTLIGWLMRLAFLAGPPVIGWIADAVSLRAGLAIIPMGALALLFACRVLPGRHGRLTP
ncbi:MAG: MFS transporter [Bowdeniella nasicola]|nr:MFS transporter [Bowdeniella nasicola]